MEYLYTNLPRYITVTPRSAFADSVVQSGSVLLFSEDGTTLTAKLPDGSFITVGGSGGTDVSDTTATAATVLAGYDFYLANGTKTTGTIQTVTAFIQTNTIVVPSGYIAEPQYFQLPDYSRITAIPSSVLAGEIFIDSSGNFQEGTMPLHMGETIIPTTVTQTVSAGKFLAGDIEVPGDANLLPANIVQGVSIFGVTGTASGGGATDYYKCATVTPLETYYAVSGAGTAAVNGAFRDTGTTWNGCPVYSNTASSTTYYMIIDMTYNVWVWFILDYLPDENDNPMPYCLYFKENQWYINEGADPVPTVTEYSGSKTWTGYKAVFNAVSGTYSFEATATSGLTYSVVTPVVGNVYEDGALIEAKLFTGIPTDYVVYHPLSSAEASVSGYNCSYFYVTFEQDSSLGETVAVFKGNGRLTISNVAGSPAIAFSIFQKINTASGDQKTVVMRDSFGILSTPSNTGVFDFNGGLELEKQYSNYGWHHIYADYANGATRLFIDGVEAANTTSFTYSYNYTSNVQMGVHLNGSSFPLYGKLKAFRMYNRQLTAAEIAALAAEFTPTPA